jgi:hypothetical protein
LHEFQVAFMPLVGGVVVAIVLSFFLRETGSAKHSAKPAAPTIGLLQPASAV